MIDRILSAVLTFGIMAGGTLAVGHEMFATHPAPLASATPADVRIVRIVELPPVVVVAKRLPPADVLVALAR